MDGGLTQGSLTALDIKDQNTESPTALDIKDQNTESPTALDIKDQNTESPTALDIKDQNTESLTALDIKTVTMEHQECHSSEVTGATEVVTESVTVEEPLNKNDCMESSAEEFTKALQQDDTSESLKVTDNAIQVSEVSLMINSEESQENVEVFNEKIIIEIVEKEIGNEATVEENVDISLTSCAIENTSGKSEINSEESFEIIEESSECSERNELKIIENEDRVEEDSLNETAEESTNITQYFSAEESLSLTEENLGSTEETNWQFSKVLPQTENTSDVSNTEYPADDNTDIKAKSETISYDASTKNIEVSEDKVFTDINTKTTDVSEYDNDGITNNNEVSETSSDGDGNVVTPDLIKTCNGANSDTSQKASLSNGSNLDQLITGSNNVIINLSPAPLSPARGDKREAKGGRTDAKGGQKETKGGHTEVKGCQIEVKGGQKETKGGKKEVKGSKREIKGTGKVKISGIREEVKMNSEKAQYFNLTMDQMRELAGIQQSQAEERQEQCCVHAKQKDDVKKFNTLPRRRKPVLPSPDIVKELQIKGEKQSAITKDERNERSSKVSRSKSFNVRRNQEAVGATTAPRQITKRSQTSKPSEGGGLFAPTKSWLNYLNGRKGVTGIEVRPRRSDSLPRTLRSVSPQRKVPVQHDSTRTTERKEPAKTRTLTPSANRRLINSSTLNRQARNSNRDHSELASSVPDVASQTFTENSNKSSKSSNITAEVSNKASKTSQSSNITTENSNKSSKSSNIATENSNKSSKSSNIATENSNKSSKSSNITAVNSNKSSKSSNITAVNSIKSSKSSNITTVNSNKSSKNSNVSTENSNTSFKSSNTTTESSKESITVNEDSMVSENSKEAIDETSESATQVIQKFETKISQVQRKKSIINGVTRSQSMNHKESSAAKIKKSDVKIVKNDSSTNSAIKGSLTNSTHSGCNGESTNTKGESTHTKGESTLTKGESTNTKGESTHTKGESTLTKGEVLLTSQDKNIVGELTRTTMVVKLNPGHNNRLSAYMENQQEKSEIRTSSSDMENIQAICGLEISFSSVPQDIDIKLIPTGDHRMMTTE